MSKSKEGWQKQYELKRDRSYPQGLMACPDCRSYSQSWEPHHPFGRHEERIMTFVWICSECHRRIHDHGTWARETGRIMPEFYGGRSDEGSINFYGLTLT